MISIKKTMQTKVLCIPLRRRILRKICEANISTGDLVWGYLLHLQMAEAKNGLEADQTHTVGRVFHDTSGNDSQEWIVDVTKTNMSPEK